MCVCVGLGWGGGVLPFTSLGHITGRTPWRGPCSLNTGPRYNARRDFALRHLMTDSFSTRSQNKQRPHTELKVFSLQINLDRGDTSFLIHCGPRTFSWHHQHLCCCCCCDVIFNLRHWIPPTRYSWIIFSLQIPGHVVNHLLWICSKSAWSMSLIQLYICFIFRFMWFMNSVVGSICYRLILIVSFYWQQLHIFAIYLPVFFSYFWPYS